MKAKSGANRPERQHHRGRFRQWVQRHAVLSIIAGAVIVVLVGSAITLGIASNTAPVVAEASVSPSPESSADQPSPTPPPAHPPRLSVSGSSVVDPTGKPIVLRGYNWGQWGTAQPQDAAANVAQGANSVRIPLRWWGQWKTGVDSRDAAAPGHIDPAHLAQLDRTITWASSHHLWVILFVDSNYGQGADGSKDNFWTDSSMRTQFFQMWSFLAARYADTPYLGALELLAEPRPGGVGDDAVSSFYDSLISVVRKADPRTPVVIGPNDGYDAARLDDAHSTADTNIIIYTADYFIFGHPLNKLSQIEAFEKMYDAPVWVNQVGIPSGKSDSLNSAETVLGALNQAGIGWAWWTYRDLGTASTGEGIYYRDTNGEWLAKTDWLTLVGSHLSA